MKSEHNEIFTVELGIFNVILTHKMVTICKRDKSIEIFCEANRKNNTGKFQNEESEALIIHTAEIKMSQWYCDFSKQ